MKKKTSQTEVHITEMSQSSHGRKAGRACRMTKQGHILIDLGQFEDNLINKKPVMFKVMTNQTCYRIT